jgi:tRNA(Ile)-lysidine synthase
VLLSRVRRTLRERRLVERGQRVLVAVSGGPDSMAMLDVLARLALEVASVDHGLREAAREEMALVERRAGELALRFHGLRVDLAPGASLQAGARAARYDALRALARELGAARIAVGHTRDDQAETVVSRLLRGAGVRGLAGIAPRRADGVIRPLIDATRRDVVAWLEGHALSSATDPSNRDPRFQRTRVRDRILPTLAVESPAISAHLAAIADDARALHALARSEAVRLLAIARRPDVAIADGASGLDSAVVGRAPVAVRRAALALWASELTERPMRRAHLDALMDAHQGRGEARLPGGWVVRQDGSLLVARRSAMKQPR